MKRGLEVNLIRMIAAGRGSVVVFVGCGGKTSAIEGVLQELICQGIPVIHTTTTKIYLPKERPVVVNSEPDGLIEGIERAKGKTVTLGCAVDGEGKLLGIPKEWMEMLHKRFPRHCILIEGDGCKGKSIKVYGEHEPCIPSQADKVVIVVGLDAFLEVPIGKVAHRVEALGKCFENKENPDLEERIAALFHPRGLVKGLDGTGEKYVFINKVTDHQLPVARKIGEEIMLLGKDILHSVILGDTALYPMGKEVIR
ncbi:selenium cofactor biosynthesis protein YqeC [Thermotalea metallivorans]|uniref:selenium cofactor biosynthesis protein YqeC n=1 Tax=Thermotalea metallivorans TaxID=520762 RepID=UPI00083800D0|nr:selenium cofactor biosynthesis protein YqeC [Thermotalea metallivorans]